ncbi:hypothetical protein Fmac_020883 [Flemingia macrophylla]|uniref:Glycoside hydrolase family 38 central domain-containing protein n=1 Tax=Flemingia macrophylla TaxID=520843 RepID=A0ABD1LVF8_9FABA
MLEELLDDEEEEGRNSALGARGAHDLMEAKRTKSEQSISSSKLQRQQLEVFRGRMNLGPNIDLLVDALAIAQQHDAVTGKEKQHVANDYSKRLYIGYKESKDLVSSSLACLVESSLLTRYQNPVTKLQQADVHWGDYASLWTHTCKLACLYVGGCSLGIFDRGKVFG